MTYADMAYRSYTHVPRPLRAYTWTADLLPRTAVLIPGLVGLYMQDHRGLKNDCAREMILSQKTDFSVQGCADGLEWPQIPLKMGFTVQFE
jgi:hypothetical protein